MKWTLCDKHSLNVKLSIFFDNEADQQAYIEHAEKEYLEATITLKDILFNSKNANWKVSKDHLIEKFEEAMQ